MPDEPRRFKFVATGPWTGWSEDEIEREILGGPAIVVPEPDDEEDD